MKTLLLCALGAAALGGVTLTTKYTSERDLKVEIESSLTLETTDMSMERDGTPVDMPGGGMTSTTKQREVHVDHVVEAKDGVPVKLRRHFEQLGGSLALESEMGSDSRELESPFEGLTLELTSDGDSVEARVVEGREPDGDNALDGHRIGLFLDALLPDHEVGKDSTWDLDNNAIRQALRLDLARVLFPPPAREEGGGEGRRGGNRGGNRGSGEGGMLGRIEWKGTAKVLDLEHDHDGTACVRVELELEGSAEYEPPAFGGGGRRGGAFGLPGAAASSTTVEVRLKGELLFASGARHPLSLELEGRLETETTIERDSERGSMRMYTARSGPLTYSVAVETVAPRQ